MAAWRRGRPETFSCTDLFGALSKAAFRPGSSGAAGRCDLHSLLPPPSNTGTTGQLSSVKVPKSGKGSRVDEQIPHRLPGGLRLLCPGQPQVELVHGALQVLESLQGALHLTLPAAHVRSHRSLTSPVCLRMARANPRAFSSGVRSGGREEKRQGRRDPQANLRSQSWRRTRKRRERTEREKYCKERGYNGKGEQQQDGHHGGENEFAELREAGVLTLQGVAWKITAWRTACGGTHYDDKSGVNGGRQTGS
ncbi:hypothetical protein EYF80_021255 [Liparis tanakae]|uniref:Uncharacterized protein n=1 Tax=Liparis tanakae TaxID=230148 RepID=A0A4Z2HS56_9TELE|nr:hypothetical protein EYF80_021255 [Liparis tanakae]